MAAANHCTIIDLHFVKTCWSDANVCVRRGCRMPGTWRGADHRRWMLVDSCWPQGRVTEIEWFVGWAAHFRHSRGPSGVNLRAGFHRSLRSTRDLHDELHKLQCDRVSVWSLQLATDDQSASSAHRDIRASSAAIASRAIAVS